MSDNKSEIVQRLLESNPEFQSLQHTHDLLKTRIVDARAALSVDEVHITDLKREKLRAKDRMEELIRTSG